MVDCIFVGSGLTNAVIARKKLDQGKKCLVLEKKSYIGGVCHTYKDGNITIHNCGAHIFHTSNEEVWNFCRRFTRFIAFVNSPKAQWRNEFYSLPFNMNTFCQLWSDVHTPEEAKARIESERTHYENPKNLEEQALNLVGRTIYEKLIKCYTEKQWGCPCDKLSPDIIKRIPLRFEFNNNYFNDIYQGIPEFGYTKMIENMFKGAEIKLNTDFLDDKEYWLSQANEVYCSCSIDDYYDFEFGHLGYRSLKFDRKSFCKEDWQGNAVINHNDHSTTYTRTIEHKHFLDERSTNTWVDFEYPENYIHGYNEPLYPLMDENNQKLYKKYLEKHMEVHGQKVIFTGRNGLYKYMDMDDCVEWALNLTKEALCQKI